MRHRAPRRERGRPCGRLASMATQRDHTARMLAAVRKRALRTAVRDTRVSRATDTRILRMAMPELQERFGAVSVRIFGSVARDEAAPDSDVDILVEFARPVSLFVLADLRLFLTEALGRPVDVGTEASLRPRIRQAVVAEAVRVA